MADKAEKAEKQAQAKNDAAPAQAATAAPQGLGAIEKDGEKPKKDLKPIDPGKMMIKVYSPYQVYFDDQATSISAINDTGPFDILPRHHRFLTLLNPCELIIAADKGEEKIKISRGIMYVKEDRVTVFLDV